METKIEEVVEWCISFYLLVEILGEPNILPQTKDYVEVLAAWMVE